MSGSIHNKLVESLRNYIVDLEVWNFLNLGEEELKTELLQEAVQDGINSYDLVPPILSTTSPDVLATDAGLISREWLLCKKYSAVETLTRLVMIHIRNENPANDQGFVVDEFNKGDKWRAFKRDLLIEVQQQAKAYKLHLNIASASGSGSGWATTTLDPN